MKSPSVEIEKLAPKAKLPHGAQFFQAKDRKFNSTILLVPFFGAKASNLARHQIFLNELGFDVVQAELYPLPAALKDGIRSRGGFFGMKHRWADQIEDLLQAIPGKKVLFTLSNPSASAIEAAVRLGCKDIQGWISDGGPAGNLWESMVNYYTTEEPQFFTAQKLLMATLMTGLWTTDFLYSLKKDIQKIPKNFPVLSVRGWKDKLIPPHLIDQTFSENPSLDLKILDLPLGGHLNGLKEFPDLYRPAVALFLESVSVR